MATATTTVLMQDVKAGNLPMICVKTGLPSEITGQFVYDRPSSFDWFAGTCGCFVLILAALPVSLPFVGVLSLGAFCVRHLRGTIGLPMTRNARWRLRVARSIGPVAMMATTAAAVAAFNLPIDLSEPPLVQVTTVAVGIAFLVWIAGAFWTLWVAVAYLQAGAGIPWFGVRVLLKSDPVRGAYLELANVNERFAIAVSAQYHGQSAEAGGVSQAP